MKKLILLAVFAMLSNLLIAKTPPESVLKAFSKKFPSATNVKWGKENAKEWEANFSIGDTKQSANFNSTGDWVETETEIPVSKLPANIVTAIHKAFPKASIVGGDKIENSKMETLYEADLKTGIRKKEVLYKNDGTLLK